MIARAGVLLFFSLLALPGIAGLTGQDRSAPVAENRVLAPAPDWPDSAAGLLAVPQQIDAWLRDHFAFRPYFVRANTRLRFALFHESPTRQTLFGRHGRLFLSGHDAAHPYSLIRDICGVGVPNAEVARAADHIDALLRKAGPDALFLSVPSAPALYVSELPPWLARQCQAAPMAARVTAGRAPNVVYPIEALRAAMQDGAVVPRYNFHWSGRGARATAAMVAEQVLGLPRVVDIPGVATMADSDLAPMTPGLTLRDTVVVPDIAAGGIAYCYARPDCLPELGDITSVVDDYSRTVSPRAGSRRLLLISDSFGSFIAPWFGAYFGEVRHISSNNFDRLSAAQMARLKQSLFAGYQPDRVIFLYHDGAITYAPARIAGLLWPAPVVASAR
jgi:hypothetical protein